MELSKVLVIVFIVLALIVEYLVSRNYIAVKHTKWVYNFGVAAIFCIAISEILNS